MKKYLLFSLVFVFCMHTLSAFSVGRDGDPYFEQEVSWQPVKYENHDCGYNAALPGEPTSGLSNDFVFNYSKFRETSFEVKSHMNGRYCPPRTEQGFLAEIENAFGNTVEIQPILPNQNTVKYVVEIFWKEESKVARIFCSSNQLYYAIVEGDDLSLAPFFFETVRIAK